MAVVWGLAFGGPTHYWTLGICMGLCMGLFFGLFDFSGGTEEKEKQEESAADPSAGESAHEPFPIRPLEEPERDAALALAWRVFSEYESLVYPPEGTEEFRKTLRDESYLAGLRYYGAFDGDKPIGLLGMPAHTRHICFFLVDGEYHRRGNGTRLFARVRADCPGETITLNSAPYGQPFFKRLGFTPTGGEQTVNGIRFTPMQ